MRTSPAPHSTRVLSFTRSVSAIISFLAFILAFPVKVLSMMVLIRFRHSRRTSCVTVSLDVIRQHVKSSWLSLENSSHVPLLLRQLRLSPSISTQEPPLATACHTVCGVPCTASVSVSSNFCLAQLHSWQCKKKLLSFDHDVTDKIP